MGFSGKDGYRQSPCASTSSHQKQMPPPGHLSFKPCTSQSSRLPWEQEGYGNEAWLLSVVRRGGREKAKPHDAQGSPATGRPEGAGVVSCLAPLRTPAVAMLCPLLLGFLLDSVKTQHSGLVTTRDSVRECPPRSWLVASNYVPTMNLCPGIAPPRKPGRRGLRGYSASETKLGYDGPSPPPPGSFTIQGTGQRGCRAQGLATGLKPSCSRNTCLVTCGLTVMGLL